MSDTIQERFERFHSDNPHIITELERLASDWFSRGNNSLGIGCLWEVLRWHLGIHAVDGGDFRLNNHYRSRYVRLMLQRKPEWKGRFELRRLTSP